MRSGNHEDQNSLVSLVYRLSSVNFKKFFFRTFQSRPMPILCRNAVWYCIAFTLISIVFFACARYEKRMSSAEDEGFTWPPPRASADVQIQRHFLVTPGTPANFGDIASRIELALGQAGYADIRYYTIPDGFAMVTRLEQINPDGTPKTDDDRWLDEVRAPKNLRDLLLGLFRGNPGRYRIIVFAVTSEPFKQTSHEPTRLEAMDWFRSGWNRLQDSVASQTYTAGHSTTALIYEFEQTAVGNPASLRYQSGLTGIEHLERSGIWQFIQN